MWKIDFINRIIFDDNLKAISVRSAIADFNLSSCEFESLLLNCCIASFYIDKNYIIQWNCI